MADYGLTEDWPPASVGYNTQGRLAARSAPIHYRSSCLAIGLWRRMPRSGDFPVDCRQNGSCSRWKARFLSFARRNKVHEGGDSTGDAGVRRGGRLRGRRYRRGVVGPAWRGQGRWRVGLPLHGGETLNITDLLR